MDGEARAGYLTVVYFRNAAGGRTFRSPVAVLARVRIERFRPAAGRRMRARAVYDEVGKRAIGEILKKPSGRGLTRQQWSRYKWYFTGAKRKPWQSHATHFSWLIDAMERFYDKPPAKDVIVSDFIEFNTDNKFDAEGVADELTAIMERQGLGKAFKKHAPHGVRFHFYAKGLSSDDGVSWIPRDFFSDRSVRQGVPVMVDLHEGIMRLVESIFRRVASNKRIRVQWVGVITYGKKGLRDDGKKTVSRRKTRSSAS